MGRGYSLGCKKCGYEISGNLGVGFMFLLVYQETLEAAKAGKLGRTVKEFLEKYALEKLEHQDFINYLVYLEGVAAIVNAGVVRLSAIDDLMAYRYFIAVNNPVVQKFELVPYQEYYQGLIKLFKKWAEKNTSMPMAETRLDLVLKAK